MRFIAQFLDDGGDPQPEVTKKELKSWYMYDVANSAFNQVVIAAFLPLLLQMMAMEHAGFPTACANYIAENNTLSNALFEKDVEMYIDNEQDDDCTNCKEYQGDMYCEGKPATSDLCFAADGKTKLGLTVKFGSYDMDPTEYVLLFLAFSVIFQTFAFISVGALGDHGNLRKRYLILSSCIGALACILCVAVTPDLWWLGGVFMIIANVFYGTGFLLYEAWLPLLAENHWEVRDMAPGPERAEKVVGLIDRISNYGFIYGFAGGLSCLIICFPFVLYSSSMFGDDATGIRVAVVIAGVWWFTIQLYTFANLKTRPGPPLPEGTHSYFIYSWGRFFDTMGRVPKMPTTMRYMILWFFYSDGVNTIVNTAVLAMGVMIRWCFVSKSVALLAMLAGLPLFSLVGLYIASWIMNKWGVSAKKIVFSALLIVSLIPTYGLIGFWTDDWGLHYGIEVVVIACIFGLCFGVVVAYSRSIMAQLIPPGYEAQFFSIFEITNRGSSWLGPVVVSQVYKQTGELRYAFIYILATTIIPALLLGMLDIEYGRKLAHEYAEQHPVTNDSDVPEKKKKITKNTYL